MSSVRRSWSSSDMLRPLIMVRTCVISILLHTGGLVMHNRLRQTKNSFLTAYSPPKGTLTAPSTLTHRFPIIIGVLQFNPVQLIDRFILITCSKVCEALLSELALIISLNCAADFFLATVPIAFFALNAGSMLDLFKKLTTSCVWNSVLSRMSISVTSNANNRQTVCVCTKISYGKCSSLGRNRKVEYIYVLDRMCRESYLKLLRTYSALHSLTQCILF